MANVASSPHIDELEQSLLVQAEVSQPARRALRQVRELEREFMLLRKAVTGLPAGAESAWQDQAANLLSRVVLFRVALAEPPVLGDSGPGSDDATAVTSRAMRG